MNNRAIGKAYEEQAAKWLEQQHMTILERNYRCRSGEIDLIGLQEHYLVFVEVKYRSTEGIGNPAEAVGRMKQQKICQVADYYRMTHEHLGHMGIRYDVVAICGEELTWYPNAFFHISSRGYSW